MKRGVCLLVLVVVMAVCVDADIITEPPCINFCPDNPFGHYECCDGGDTGHPGQCPIRIDCPESSKFRLNSAPKLCQRDNECSDREKCCLDACIEKKVCVIAD